MCLLAGCNSILGIHHFNGDVVDGPVVDSERAHDGTTPSDGAIAWWDVAWAHRSSITIDNSMVTAPLVGFPVLLTLTPSTFTYNAAESDGADLRVIAADDATELPHEIDTFQVGGTSYVWVAIDLPAAPAPAPTAWLYYGNPGAASDANPAALWQGNVSVHHLSDLTDATGSGHDGSDQETANPPTETAGIVGSALEFGNNVSGIDLAKPTDYSFTSAMSASLWIKTQTIMQAQACIACKGTRAWEIETDQSRTSAAFATTSAGVNSTIDATAAIDDGAWHHVAVSQSGNARALYIDGVVSGQANNAQALDVTTDAMSFGQSHGGLPHGLQAELDEVRITGAVRPAAWFATEYRSITDPAFAVLGPVEQAP